LPKEHAMNAADDGRSVGWSPAAGTAAPAPPAHGGMVGEVAPLDVDEVSNLSFPASDPPSSGPGLA
jgi:hypothetical protein